MISRVLASLMSGALGAVIWHSLIPSVSFGIWTAIIGTIWFVGTLIEDEGRS